MTGPYDAIETNYLEGFLRQELPHYLDFHSANFRHLPHNFESIGKSLEKSDSRYIAINKIGYLSYSVFINLLLAFRAVENISTNPKESLITYDLLSGVFLRIGAAIDIAKSLDEQLLFCYHEATKKLVKGRKDTSAWDGLKQELKDIDGFNNYLKHNGLPTLRYGQDGLSAPKQIPCNALGWSSQVPTEKISKLLTVEIKRTLNAFDSFYEALTMKIPALHQRWNINGKQDLISIHDIAVENGYTLTRTSELGNNVPQSGVFER